MTLDEAIKLAEDVAEEKFNSAVCILDKTKNDVALSKALEYKKCAEEHRQLAQWLKELKQLRANGYGWIPVSSGELPKEKETVIASTKYGVYPEARYSKEYGWEWAYESGTDYWRELEDVEAYMPLPEKYKAESENKDNKE